MSDSDAFTALRERCRRRCEAALTARLPPAEEEPRKLHEAMRYACLAGGKRLRALLAYAGAELCGAAPDAVDDAAAALEMMHAYSLVHDDLPAMDNDVLRRGRPSCHARFGEATAILAGNALQALAFTVLAGDGNGGGNTARRLAMIRTLAEAGGSIGMVGGQSLDQQAEAGEPLTPAALQRMHRMKTGALIGASVRLGALAADCDDAATLRALAAYGDAIGLAFQIVDDVLDARGDAARLGKTGGKDQAAHKQTYVTALGMDEAACTARTLHGQALASLRGFGDNGGTLRQIADFIVRRDH